MPKVPPPSKVFRYEPPKIKECTRRASAEHAELVLKFFAELGHDGPEHEECGQDLLTDLMHLYEQKGWDWCSAIGSATSHFEYEKGHELDEEIT